MNGSKLDNDSGIKLIKCDSYHKIIPLVRNVLLEKRVFDEQGIYNMAIQQERILDPKSSNECFSSL